MEHTGRSTVRKTSCTNSCPSSSFSLITTRMCFLFSEDAPLRTRRKRTFSISPSKISLCKFRTSHWARVSLFFSEGNSMKGRLKNSPSLNALIPNGRDEVGTSSHVHWKAFKWKVSHASRNTSNKKPVCMFISNTREVGDFPFWEGAQQSTSTVLSSSSASSSSCASCNSLCLSLAFMGLMCNNGNEKYSDKSRKDALGMVGLLLLAFL
mmetsp:Transcript_25733/g.64825  ORF Transcript_25733/g.64825 Transcript_25733/m.64825 type:complete len:209 (+) Transcript_25733:2866-3492(+)